MNHEANTPEGKLVGLDRLLVARPLHLSEEQIEPDEVH